MYNYKEQKKKIFTEDGVEMFIAIRDHARALIAKAGAVSMERAIETVTGESFTMIACMERLVELGEIKEVKQGILKTQNRIFIRGLK